MKVTGYRLSSSAMKRDDGQQQRDSDGYNCHGHSHQAKFGGTTVVSVVADGVMMDPLSAINKKGIFPPTQREHNANTPQHPRGPLPFVFGALVAINVAGVIHLEGLSSNFVVFDYGSGWVQSVVAILLVWQ